MNAHSIGSAAAQTMSRGGEARVMGITSRGLFLSSEQRVLFVSVEHWRGPLTINVDRAFDCAIGDNVRLSAARLIFPATEVDLSAAEVWQPSAPSATRPIANQHEALQQLASSVLARKTPDGFGPLLPHLLDLPEKPTLSAGEAALLARLTQLRFYLKNYVLASSFPHASSGNPAPRPTLNANRQFGCPINARDAGHDENSRVVHADVDQLTTILAPLLGLGRGLTPSGDDVTIGLLLSLNRWREARPSTARRASFDSTPFRSGYARRSAQDALTAFNHHVVELAYQRTTTISANLIECAADGEADERLINVVDGLVTGTPSHEECVECVLGWGNSSGLDALIGMALTLSVV